MKGNFHKIDNDTKDFDFSVLNLYHIRNLTISNHTETGVIKALGQKTKTTLSFPKEIILEEKLSVTEADTITTNDKKLVTAEA